LSDIELDITVICIIGQDFFKNWYNICLMADLQQFILRSVLWRSAGSQAPALGPHLFTSG